MSFFHKAMQAIQMLKLDGWQNASTGLGTSVDKQTHSTYGVEVCLSDDYLDNLYNDPLAARIVNKLPEDALRLGIKFKVADDEGEAVEVEQAILGAAADLHLTEAVDEAATFGRLYGGAAIWPICNDGDPPETPLDVNKLRKISSLLVLDKRELTPYAWDTDPTSPTLGQVVMYMLQPRHRANGASVTRVSTLGTSQYLIHASRLVVFEGAKTTKHMKDRNQGWSLSVLQRPHTVLSRYNMGWAAVSHLLTDASQGVYKVKDLLEALAGDGEAILTRMRIIDRARSVARAVVVDADTESFERMPTSFTGLPDTIREMTVSVAAAADMPVTVMMGQSPAGLNATGESDRGLWDERVQSFRTLKLTKPIERLMFLLMSCKDGPTRGRVPENWEVVWPPLREMTEEQRALIKKTTADTDAVYIQNQVMTPEEVALTRFTSMGWSAETTIDTSVRLAVLEADRKLALGTPADPEAVTPEAEKTLVLTPSATAAIVTVNEARVQSGLPAVPWGKITIAEYMAANSSVVAEAANAEAGAPRLDSHEDANTLRAVLRWLSKTA